MRWLKSCGSSTGEKNADVFTLAARMEGLICLSDRLSSVRPGRNVFIFPPNVSPHQCVEKKHRIRLHPPACSLRDNSVFFDVQIRGYLRAHRRKVQSIRIKSGLQWLSRLI